MRRPFGTPWAVALSLLVLAGSTALAGAAAPGPLLRFPTGLNSQQANGHSGSPRLSDDSRYIAFQSDATNLVAGDTNGARDAFVFDRQTGDIERVSLTASGAEATDGACCFDQGIDISGDGRYVVFHSTSEDMDDVAGQNTFSDIFLRDRQTGALTQVTHAADGGAANGHSRYPGLSADGRHVLFQSDADNLVPNDTNGQTDVFVYDVAAQTIRLISISASGGVGNGLSETFFGGKLSTDGRYVVFASRASNLVAGDGNANGDVFIRDRDADADGIFDEAGPGETLTTLISVTPGGQPAAGFSYSPSISRNGRFVVFASTAPNLVADDTNAALDVFVRDLTTGMTEIVSLRPDGSPGDGSSSYGVISNDGRIVILQSTAQLTDDAPNLFQNVFLRDRETGLTTLLSKGGGEAADLSSQSPMLSPDGRTAVFQSYASNLVPNDTNNVSDLFVVIVQPDFLLYLPTLSTGS